MQTDSGYWVAYWCDSFAHCAVALNSLAWSKIFSLQNPKLLTLNYLNFNQTRAVKLVEPNRTRTLTMTEPNRTRTFIVGFDSHLCLVSENDNLRGHIKSCPVQRRQSLQQSTLSWTNSSVWPAGAAPRFWNWGRGQILQAKRTEKFLTLPLFGQWGRQNIA